MAKELQGIFFWGHGLAHGKGPVTGLLTNASNAKAKNDEANLTYFSQWDLPYQLGIGIFYNCFGGPKSLFAPNGNYWGKLPTDELVPFPFHLFAPPVSKLIPPGAEATKR